MLKWAGQGNILPTSFTKGKVKTSNLSKGKQPAGNRCPNVENTFRQNPAEFGRVFFISPRFSRQKCYFSQAGTLVAELRLLANQKSTGYIGGNIPDGMGSQFFKEEQR
jgi:hypothetical protein